jgi:PKD repeat protein
MHKTKIILSLVIVLITIKLHAQNCNAYFNYSVDSTNLVTFMDSSNASTGFFITSWFWDFGDGTSSGLQNPTHQFNTSGAYYVCLTITDSVCSDTYCDSVYINASSPSFDVSGEIFMGTATLSNGKVKIFNSNQSNPAIDSAIVFNGNYTLSNIIPGNYKILAIPDPIYTNYLPTYLGDVTDFNNAYIMNLQGNAFSVDIHLQEVVGINSLTKNDITISPNPFTNKIELDYNEKAHENIKICIYSILGNIVYQTEVSNSEEKTSIDLSYINAGVYFIKISSFSAKPITKKIIKK